MSELQGGVMNITIRRMVKSDLDAVYAIEKSVHIAPWSMEIIGQCILVGYDCRVLELVDDKGPIIGGYIIIRCNDVFAHILNLCIAKVLQSKGYGHQLLQAVIHSISTLSQIKEIFLEVRPSNRVALHLYQSLGFDQVEIKKGYYNEGPLVEDAIVLKKIISRL